jgi:small subunit ribosomal protein S17
MATATKTTRTTEAGGTVQETRRKTKVGRVVSDKMDKTIVVSVERLARHPIYKRVIRLTTKFKAHDEANDAHVGDTVLIEESRPLSATKRWRLVSVVARAGEHGHGSPSDLVAEEAEVIEAIHAAAHPGRQRDEPATEADAQASTDAAAEAPAAAASRTAAEEAESANAPSAAADDASGASEGGDR